MTLNLNFILEKLFTVPAPIILVCGRMGLGKTDFSLFLCETLLNRKLVDTVGTNIEVVDPRFIKITSMTKLEKWLAASKQRKLFVLDEAGIYIDSRNPFSQLNKRIRKVAMLLRHYHAKFMVITQREKDLESTIRDLISAKIEKIGLKTAIVTSPIFGDEEIVLSNIPQTTIPFDSYKISEFSLTEELTEEEMTQLPLCCKVRVLLEKHGWKYRKVAKELGMHEEQIRRQLIYHLRHIEQQAGFKVEKVEEALTSQTNTVNKSTTTSMEG